jgi:polyisoprenyl-phosphate glycosyltransferase
VQLFSIGILGEYILRIFFQVKQRPLYIVKSKILRGKVINE